MRSPASIHSESSKTNDPPEPGREDPDMAKADELHRKSRKRQDYQKAHAELAPEFALARAVISARALAGLTQEQLAQRMDTTKSVIARLETGRNRPSTRTLERLAAATGTRLHISFERTPARASAEKRNVLPSLLLDLAARIDVHEGIRQGMADAAHGLVQDLDEFIAEFEQEQELLL